MIRTLNIGHHKATFTWAKITTVIGVNSKAGEGQHILMWDFDEIPLEDVKTALRVVQTRYWLSDIRIIRTKEPDNYQAWCFSTFDLQTAAAILASTEHIDWQFFRFGVFRQHWTLRTSPKLGRTPKFCCQLEGYREPDISPVDLKSWVKYETLDGGIK